MANGVGYELKALMNDWGRKAHGNWRRMQLACFNIDAIGKAEHILRRNDEYEILVQVRKLW